MEFAVSLKEFGLAGIKLSYTNEKYPRCNRKNIKAQHVLVCWLATSVHEPWDAMGKLAIANIFPLIPFTWPSLPTFFWGLSVRTGRRT